MLCTEITTTRSQLEGPASDLDYHRQALTLHLAMTPTMVAPFLHLPGSRHELLFLSAAVTPTMAPTIAYLFPRPCSGSSQPQLFLPRSQTTRVRG